MGYHVIVQHTAEGVVSRYVERVEDLAVFSDLTADAVVYQGEPHWVPVRLGSHEHCRDYIHDWFRAGVKAQALFRVQALAHGLTLENLSQDQASFKNYTECVDRMVKRGDVLIRNARNLEVEIKCKKWLGSNGDQFVYLPREDLAKHENMAEFTGSPIAIAFYDRDGDSPVEDSLHMVYVSDIRSDVGKRVIEERNDLGAAFKIPLSMMSKGFALVDGIVSKKPRRSSKAIK